MQVAHYDENFIFDAYHGEWMKWTIHANYTGRYTFEIKHRATADYSANMAILTFVDGVQVLEQYNVTVVDNIFVTLGSFVLGTMTHRISHEISN